MTTAAEKLILVVDDEADLRKFLKMALEDAGFKVDTACDGFEALEKVSARKPDLISLDLVMPKKSGAKFYHDLQKNKEWAKIPILIVTGHAQDELGKSDLEQLTMSGPGIYLEKPVKPHSYIAAVRKMLNIPEGDSAQSAEETLRSELQKLFPQENGEKLESFLKSADRELLKKLLDKTKQS